LLLLWRLLLGEDLTEHLCELSVPGKDVRVPRMEEGTLFKEERKRENEWDCVKLHEQGARSQIAKVAARYQVATYLMP
jgi:hypothetical protein